MNLKRIFIFLFLAPLLCLAQTALYNNGSSIYVQQAGLIHVQGGLLNTNPKKTLATFYNDGIIELTGDFENDPGNIFTVNTNSNSTDRAVKFVGSGTQHILGSMDTAGRSSFYNLVIDMTNASDTVETEAPLMVQGSLVFGTANTTTTYNPSGTYTNNNQLGLLKSFYVSVPGPPPPGQKTTPPGTVNENVINIQNGNADAISGYPVLGINGFPATGYILTSGIRGSSAGGLQRTISSATSYTFPVGTCDKGFQGVTLNFSTIPGNGNVTIKFCSGSSNPTGAVGNISNLCAGCSGPNAGPAPGPPAPPAPPTPNGGKPAPAPPTPPTPPTTPATSGFNAYIEPSGDCGAAQWVNFSQTVQNHGYWSMESTPDTGYVYDLEVFPNTVSVGDISQFYRVLKHEVSYGADPTLDDWTMDIDTTVSGAGDLITYTLNAGCYSGNGVPGGSYTGFCQFGIGQGGDGGGALPVNLLYVQAEAMGKHCINVTWATAVEINNHGFEVMRSTDGVNFTDVGWVEGHDNSTVQNNYSFMDRVPQNTTYYYKLKQEDNNGNFVYSNIVQATLANEAESDFALYPNPTSNQLFINVSNPANEVDVTIYDMAGQEVFQNIFTVEQNGIAQVYSINVAAILHVGTYIVTAKTNGTQFSSKFVLQ